MSINERLERLEYRSEGLAGGEWDLRQLTDRELHVLRSLAAREDVGLSEDERRILDALAVRAGAAREDPHKPFDYESFRRDFERFARECLS